MGADDGDRAEYAAPVIAINSDSDHASTKASMTSTKSSLKLRVSLFLF
jgi:hypothetical protein